MIHEAVLGVQTYQSVMWLVSGERVIRDEDESTQDIQSERVGGREVKALGQLTKKGSPYFTAAGRECLPPLYPASLAQW
jgi:hypothetical protein